ncbi:MAG: glycosyltransferase [Candidatus Methanomethylophilaceae archaeon]|nr:glycosyltransferase [Candidatus Methanomethylophilaceae archaeon]
MVKVSVIIPVYNGSKHIHGCVSVINMQTHSDLDVIFVVDSKTTDDTIDRIISETSGDPRFRVIMQNDDQRMGGARNIGFDAALGDYIWFLDVDDHPYPTLIEEVVDIAERESSPVVFFNSIYSSDWDLPEKEYGRYSVKVMSPVEALFEVGRGGLSLCPWSRVYRTGFLRENSIRFIAGYCEDFKQTVDSLLVADKVVYYNKPLYVYYQHGSSLCGGSNDDSIAQRDVELSGEMCESFRERFPDDYERFCGHLFRHVIRSLTRASPEKFRELSKSEGMRKLASHKSPEISMDVLIYRVSPAMFYRIGNYARNRKYSMKSDVLFDGNLS